MGVLLVDLFHVYFRLFVRMVTILLLVKRI